MVVMVAEENSEIFRFTNVRQQYLCTIAANLIAISQGVMIGWLSPALPTLQSSDSPLTSGPLSNEDISWIGSINLIGALVGSLNFNYLTDFMGSKRATFFLAFPYIVSWLLIYFGTSYYVLLLARLISGWAGAGVQATIILYVFEIANDDIRGRLASVTQFARNIGTLIGYILGASVSYHWYPLISILNPIMFAGIFIMLPNTPRFHLQRGQILKAEKALKYYKGYKGQSQKEDDAFFKEFERLKAVITEQKQDEKFVAAEFFDRTVMKGLFMGISLILFAELTGFYTLTSYAVTTFEKVGTTIDPYKSSITLAVALTLGSLATASLADKLGRKVLILISLLGAACGLFTVAGYHYAVLCGYDLASYAWIPMVSLSAVIFLASAGIIPLCYICCVETIPAKVLTYGMTIIYFSDNCISFASLKTYPLLLESLDLHRFFSIYGCSCVVGFVFLLFALKETSGKRLDEIQHDEQKTGRRITIIESASRL